LPVEIHGLLLPKKRREGVKLEAFESDIEKVIKGE